MKQRRGQAAVSRVNTEISELAIDARVGSE